MHGEGRLAGALDHLGDVLKRRGALREALDYWRKALQGEDEGEELDRTVVQRKIREAQAGNVQASIGKVSFSAPQLEENAKALIDAVLRAKPAAAKGKYVKSAHLSSTMGPGVSLDSSVTTRAEA